MQALLGRLAARLGLALVVAALVTGGVVLLLAALFLWLERLFDPATAALLTGVAVLVTAGLLLLAARAVVARPARPRPPATPAAFAAALGAQAGGLARQQAQAGLRGHGTQAVLMAAVAGFALGVSPRLRRTVLRLLD